ncbi:MAG TPA: DUF2007 domain-containing protein [Acidobacteriaceae bacterium]
MSIARTYDELTEPAQRALREEFSRRSLEPPIVEDTDEMELAGRAMVTVGVYRDLPEAILARTALEGEGIECFLANENIVRMDWMISNMIGGMLLQVDAKDETHAREILAEPIPSNIAFAEGEEFTQPECPFCGSLDIAPEDSDRKVVAASMLIGLPIPHSKPTPDHWRCFQCGKHWQNNEGSGSGKA